MKKTFEENNDDRNHKYKYILNNLIAADDLHWNEDENKYNALSKEELDSILLSCVNQGIINEDDCYDIVNWATNVKVGEILLKNFIEGKIVVSYINKKGEPSFLPNKIK